MPRVWRGRRALTPTHHQQSIEAAAYFELLSEAGPMTTAALERRLKQRGFIPRNLTTTLLRSKRIYAMPRADPSDRYRWYVDRKERQT